MLRLLATIVALITQPASGAGETPIVEVVADNTEIRSTCIIRIEHGRVIPDADGNGVIHITASGVRIRFEAGSVLREGSRGVRPDQHAGCGIRVSGQHDVTIEDIAIEGYKCGVHASDCRHFALRGGAIQDGYRSRLGSTPAAEDSADWLYPHDNDGNQQFEQHGAAVFLEECLSPEVRGVRVRSTQNGIMMRRVDCALIVDNDCSFLSGWGLSMWRSCRNTISRSAFDFCIRGYEHGVYNRGQDSAGILCFEQCSENLFVENSATHGGDGFFGFAGRDALGEVEVNGARPAADDRRRAGCNDNVLLGNDFSYAAAHGIEMTFSFGNRFDSNRVVENAICGIWGGYSQDSIIVGNTFERNGDMAYGLERGGVNIEHSAGNIVMENAFLNNRCGIHLWWRDPGGLATTPWFAVNHRDISGNVIAKNRFVINADHPFGSSLPAPLPVLHLRDVKTADDAGGHFGRNVYGQNEVLLDPACGVELAVDDGIVLDSEDADLLARPALASVIGEHRPVGARPELRGRHNIIMTEWGPWDHHSLMVRKKSGGPVDIHEVFGSRGDVTALCDDSRVRVRVEKRAEMSPPRHVVTIESDEPCITYSVSLVNEDETTRISGTLIRCRWSARFWGWTIDPLADLDGWRKESLDNKTFQVSLSALDLNYGYRGPGGMSDVPALVASGLGADRFGMVAETEIGLPAGTYQLTTRSDDGIRIFVNDQVILARWDIHGPSVDAVEFQVAAGGATRIRVEHFENSGYATLAVSLAPMPVPEGHLQP